MLTARPLALAAAFCIIGILAARFCQPPPSLLLLTGIAALVPGIYNRRREWVRQEIYFYIAVAVTGALIFQWQVAGNTGNISGLAGRAVAVRGTVVAEPEVRPNSVSYILRVEQFAGLPPAAQAGYDPYQSTPDIRGRILLTVTGPAPRYYYGDRLAVSGTPVLPEEPGNPGEFDYRRYLEIKGIQLIMKSWHNAGVTRLGRGPVNPLVDICLRFKDKMVSVLESTMSPSHAGLMRGILFGSCGLIDPQVRSDFSVTGVVHILSVSGYHMGLLVALCLLISKTCGLGRVSGLVLTFAATGAYAVISGMGSAVLRSLVMAWVFASAGCLKRRYDWPSALGLAALVILVVNPQALFEPGFQLSFAATWGILVLAPLLKQYFVSSQTLFQKVGLVLAVTVSAQAAVLPITVYYFNYISLIALPANLVIVPLISLVMILGGFGVAAGLVWLPLGETVNISTGLVLRAVVGLARYMAALPYGNITVKQPSVMVVTFLYLIVCGAAAAAAHTGARLRIRRLWSLHKAKLAAGALAAAAVVLWAGIIWPAHPQLEATFLDIGEGDAVLITTPAGYRIMVDTGGAPHGSAYDPGEKVLVPYLRRQGITRLDLLVLTHPHADHIGGARALLANLKVDLLAVSRRFRSVPAGAGLVHEFTAKGTQIREITGGEQIQFAEDITLEILSPQDWFAASPQNGMPGSRLNGVSDNANNDSLVMRLNYGSMRILLTGDAEEPVLKGLIAGGVDVSADIVKIPHHGSLNGWFAPFYRAVHAGTAVISVGPNYFGHPAPELLEGLAALNIPVYRTDRDGAVLIRSDGREYSIGTGHAAAEDNGKG